MREKIILSNPVTGVHVPKQSAESVEMLPITEAELEEAFGDWAAHSEHLANVLNSVGLDGPAVAEARALVVGMEE